MTCKARLEKYFRENGVPFQSMTHPVVYTAQEMAAAQHVSGHQVAKTVIGRVGKQLVMLVLPASCRVNLDKLPAVLGSESVDLAKEPEFRHLFPDCEVGAMPPFGNLYNLPVYVDRSLSAVREIVFRAGTHQDTMKIAYADFVRLANPIVADFAVLS
jgi:Ala-tRNA(Pro) deacylase